MSMPELRIHISEAELLDLVQRKIQRSIKGSIPVNSVLIDLSFEGHEHMNLCEQIEAWEHSVPIDGVFVTVNVGLPHEPTIEERSRKGGAA